MQAAVQFLHQLPNSNPQIQQQQLLKDPNVLPHLATLLYNLDKSKVQSDILHLSTIAKITQPKLNKSENNHYLDVSLPLTTFNSVKSTKDLFLKRFIDDARKLEWAGFGLPKQEVFLIENSLKQIGQSHQAKQIRFWGKILGAQRDYYVIQGVTGPIQAMEEVIKGGEKRGEGANYYTYWVCNDLLIHSWTQLPQITPQHIKTARKIKYAFTGNLFNCLNSQPHFYGQEQHYLKAQLVRMTSSLQLVPKGIYKPNDDNPKIVEFEQQVKIPQFGELATIQTWVHRNQNLLHLGRCTHYIDPATPEDQLEAVTAELTQKDPQVERLRGITEDKLPEGNSYGVECIWQARVLGDNQIFQKEEAANVYGIVVLKNLFWPGWVTLGYKGGFTNYYTGYGHKASQPAWSYYQNAGLGQQAQQIEEFREPNPKDEPKPPAEPAPEQPPEE